MPPEDAGVAGAGDERKRPLGVVVDRRIELADDVEEHARRDGEGRPAVAAIGRMADAIASILARRTPPGSRRP